MQYFDKALTFIVIGGMVYLIIFSFLNVFFRYVLQSSILFWADEVLRYSMIWFIFIGSTLGVARKLHVKIDVVQKYLPESWCYWLTLAGYIAMFFFFIFMSRLGIQFAKTGTTMYSPALSLRMSTIYSIIPVCFVLMAINTIRLIIREYILVNHPACSGWEEFL